MQQVVSFFIRRLMNIQALRSKGNVLTASSKSSLSNTSSSHSHVRNNKRSYLWPRVKLNHCYHLSVDYFPITVHPKVSSYTTALKKSYLLHNSIVILFTSICVNILLFIVTFNVLQCPQKSSCFKFVYEVHPPYKSTTLLA